MNNLNKNSSLVKALFAFLCFALVILASQTWLSNFRLDLTQQKIYSFSQGTKKIVENLDQDVTITLFFSDKASKDLTALRSYALSVQELLAEYVLLSKGKLRVNIIDPEPFSENEDLAAEFGLQAVPIGNGSDLYFGLSAQNAAGAEGVIAFLQPDKEAFLEYQISELIYRLGQSRTPVVGLMSNLDIRGGFDMQSGGSTPPWAIYDQLDEMFDVRWVDEKLEDLDEEIELLILVQPSIDNENTLYELDQFVMKGGKLLVFIDPKVESQSPQESQSGENLLMTLFSQWGIEYQANQVLTDDEYALTISTGENQPPLRHLGLLGIQADSLNRQEVVTSELEVVNFASAGVLIHKQVEGIRFDALVSSSYQAQAIPLLEYSAANDPSQLMQTFNASGESYVLAARLSGSARSAFTQKPENSVYGVPHINESQNINLVVVADTDVLTDRLWVQVQSFFGQRIKQPWADNGAFVNNMVEQFLGSSDLINIRSRGRFTRPFTVVEDIQQQAQSDYQDHEQQLQEQLQATEQQLALLEQERSKDSLTLSPAQEQALADFQQQKLHIRKALREVRHELNKEIDVLEGWLKVLNIIVLPLFLTLVLLLLARRKLSKQ
jgi:ABC-type uncharacterized transport system involved in gliding motility auxiliary subunit